MKRATLKSKQYVVSVTLAFDQHDIKTTKKWWKQQKYSNESLAFMLMDATLAGIVTPGLHEIEKPLYYE